MKQDRRIMVMLLAVVVFCVGVLLVMNSRPTPAPTCEGVDTVGLQNVHRAQPGPSLAGRVEEGATLSPFDPNTIDSVTLISFGLSVPKVRNFIHYRRAGKVFRTPDDLLDTYGWEAADLEYLRPYIHISRQYQQAPHHPTSRGGHSNPTLPVKSDVTTISLGNDEERSKFRTLTLVDVNTADTALLQRIPGIGSHYSRCIVRLREKLGGIYSLEQLFEIRDFPAQTLEWLEVRQPVLRQINVNTADFKTLAAHPYIGYDRTRLIQRHNRLYGPFSNAQQLIDAGIFTPDDIAPVLPYLTFE